MLKLSRNEGSGSVEARRTQSRSEAMVVPSFPRTKFSVPKHLSKGREKFLSDRVAKVMTFLRRSVLFRPFLPPGLLRIEITSLHSRPSQLPRRILISRFHNPTYAHYSHTLDRTASLPRRDPDQLLPTVSFYRVRLLIGRNDHAQQQGTSRRQSAPQD